MADLEEAGVYWGGDWDCEIVQMQSTHLTLRLNPLATFPLSLSRLPVYRFCGGAVLQPQRRPFAVCFSRPVLTQVDFAERVWSSGICP